MNHKKLPLLLFLAILTLWSQSLDAQLELPRPSSKAGVWQMIGLTEVKIKYSRPKVTAANGTDRTDAIWGKVVPYEMTGNNRPAGPMPWRAGANENTVISFSDDVKIEGQDLPAGTYGFHMVVHENGEATLIFNKDYHQWGSFAYDESQDALRVKIKTTEVPRHEVLTYEFIDVTQKSAICALTWEKKQFPFKIEVDTDAILVSSVNKQLGQSLGFHWNSFVNAANYIVKNEGDYEQGLKWIDQAINGFGGNFTLYKTKSDLLVKLEKEEEAGKIMDIAMGMGSVNDLFTYGQQLLGAQKNEKAMEVFQMNVEKMKSMAVVGDMDKFTVYAGLSMGHRAHQEFDEAIENAKKAKEAAPTDRLKGMVDNFIGMLEKSKAANNK